VNPIDKRRVRASFSRSAPAYDARATVQRRVRERVLALVAEVAPRARRVLDVGAGTGALLARLAEACPLASATAVDLAPGMCRMAREAAPGANVAAADAESLPFRSGSFDLFVSTSTFQWLPRLGPALAEAHRVVAPGGALCLALFGARTLCELREAWRAAAGASTGGTHVFFGRDDVAEALDAAGFARASVCEEDVVEWHEDARAVLRTLKEVGATSAVPGRAGLGGRARTLEMLRRYDALRAAPEGVPATYHVVYAVAQRP
jgi:malonyl-CoA O-methyltransferase